MSIWIEVELNGAKYYETKKHEYLEKIIKDMEYYIKHIAHNSHMKGIAIGVDIPMESFYSEYLIALWQGIEFYATDKGQEYKLKNIILKRLNIAEKIVWRDYKSKLNKNADIVCHSVDITEIQMLKEETTTIDYTEFKEILYMFSSTHPTDGMIIKLLTIGYQPSEIVKILNISTTYDAKSRKKIQRVRKKFIEYMNIYS